MPEPTEERTVRVTQPDRGPRGVPLLVRGGVALLAAAAVGACSGGGGSASGQPSSSPTPRVSASVPQTGPTYSGPPLVGVSVPRRPQLTQQAQVVQTLQQEFGKLPVARVYDSGPPPATWTANPVLAALPEGTNVVYSFKGDVQQAADGAYDDVLRRFLAGKPSGITVWVAFWHEPEDDVKKGTFSAEQYRAAQAHLAPIIRSSGAIPTQILMMYTLDAASGRDWHDYFSPADDVLAWDGYSPGGATGNDYVPASNFIDPVVKISRETGKPFGWAEFGSVCRPDDTSCSGRAAWLKQVTDAMRAAGPQFVIYWNSETGGKDYRLTDQGSIDTLKAFTTTS